MVSQLRSDSDNGLESAAVIASRRQYGWNELVSAPEPVWKRLLRQFNDVGVWILPEAGADYLREIEV